MKRVLVKLDKKDFVTKIEGKDVVSLGGAFYCAKCGYKMIPEVQTIGKDKFQRAEFYLDMACLCDQK
jgi:hypothetical protein